MEKCGEQSRVLYVVTVHCMGETTEASQFGLT